MSLHVPATGTPVTSADDSDLAALKTAISNGEVLGFNSFIYSWDEIKIKSDPGVDNRFVGETVVRGCKDTEGGHGVVIVGYNDNIWTDINGNNKVDSGEMGAFKIANSWGTWNGNNGYYWIAYDAMNKVSAVSGAPSYPNRQPGIDTVSTIKVEPKKYESDVYLKYVLKSSERASYRGTATADYGEMYYDLNNVIPDIDIASLNDYDWEVKVVDKTNNGKPLSIIEVKFVDDTTGGEYDLLDGKTYTINGSSKVFSTSNVTFPFSADVKVSPSSIHTLEEVRITALTKGGNAPFKYQFELEKDGYERSPYNCFINAQKTPENAKNRVFSPMDMFPTTLSAMGAEIKGDRLGLGTDLFSGRQTLAEEIGREEFTKQIQQNSKYFNEQFWKDAS